MIDGNLGVCTVSVLLGEADGLGNRCTLSELVEVLSRLKYEVVDLTTYRPPAHPWQNNRGTLVLKLATDTHTMLNLGAVIVKSRPDEYDYIFTHDGTIFVRLVWH